MASRDIGWSGATRITRSAATRAASTPSTVGPLAYRLDWVCATRANASTKVLSSSTAR